MKNEKKFLFATIAILVIAISSFALFQQDAGSDLEAQILECKILNGTAEFKSQSKDLDDDNLDSTQNNETEKETIDHEQTETNDHQRTNIRIDLDDIGKLILARKR